MLYLLPSELDGLFATAGANYAIMVFGWLTVATSMYSLLVSPAAQPAIFRMQSKGVDIEALHRPSYCLFLYCLRLSTYFTLYANGSDSRTGPVDQVGYSIFAALPALWFIGLLPPLDAFFAWTSEQYLVILCGGSPMGTDLRLGIMCVASTACAMVTYALFKSDYPLRTTAAWAAGSGFILSCDLASITSWIFKSCSRGTKISPMGVRDDEFNRPMAAMPRKTSPPSTPTRKRMLADGVMLAGVVLAAFFCTTEHATLNNSVTDILDASVWGTWGLSLTIRSLLPVYTAYGLLRNPLYPGSVYHKSHANKMKVLARLGTLYRFIRGLSPMLIVGYISYFYGEPAGNWALPVVLAFATTRSYRAATQNPDRALFEVAVTALISRAIGRDEASTWLELPMVVQLSIVAFGHDRFDDMIDKINFVLRFTYASWFNKKLRVSFTAPLLIGSALLFPLVLTIILVSVVLGSPLMPLFGLPLFIVAFPRPRRFWPSPGSSSSPKPESIYYDQAMPALEANFAKLAAAGSLGAVTAGSQYLVKFEDRTVHIQVLEVGYDYILVVAKGLELRETTSCHDLESTRVGDMFDAAFEADKLGICARNQHMDAMMVPVQSSNIITYSDKTYSQAGVIDSPDTLKNIHSFLGYTLVWVLQERLKRPFPDRWRRDPSNIGGRNGAALFSVAVPDSWIQKVVNGANGEDSNIQAWDSKQNEAASTSTAQVVTKRQSAFEDEFADIFSDESKPIERLSKNEALADVISGRDSHVSRGRLGRQNTKHYSTIRSVVSSCFASATVSPLSVASACAFFRGEVPVSVKSQPFMDTELETLILKAFRYAVKCALDNFDPTLPGDLEVDEEELFDDLSDFEHAWHLGPEGTQEWKTAVAQGTQGLFSVISDSSSQPPTVKSRLLTTRKVEVRVGRLNTAAITGQWASLAHELLYLTNDDDERYSIQAHETALRNLTVQAADPPLGYPVFNKRLPLALI